jgi:hypothetical protein
MAQWLGVHLGCADAGELTAKKKKEQTQIESFQYFREAHTPAWFATRQSLAQSFLDRFVRQNIAEIDEIPWNEQAVRVTLPPAERALYIELKNHLEALDMKNNHKTIKAKCKSENDREARLAQVLGGSQTPDEALMKRCASFDVLGDQGKGVQSAAAACDFIVKTRRKQLEMCKAEIVRQTAYARDAIAAFEKAHPLKTLASKFHDTRKMPAEHLQTWRSKEIYDCGDTEASEMLVPLVAEAILGKAVKVEPPAGDKTFKDKMAWTRDQVHALRRLQKELTGRVRSLRFFENVRKLQRGDGPYAQAPLAKTASPNRASPKRASPNRASPKRAAPAKAKEGALLSCCGHMGGLQALRDSADRQECPTAGCKAPARPSCVVPVRDLGTEQADDTHGKYGAKLTAIAKLISSLPKKERVLVFVQFPELLVKVDEALRSAGIQVAMLTGTAKQRSTTIETFQAPEMLKGDKQVLLLNLKDESAAGANLTTANHAIFVHPLLVDTQARALARSARHAAAPRPSPATAAGAIRLRRHASDRPRAPLRAGVHGAAVPVHCEHQRGRGHLHQTSRGRSAAACGGGARQLEWQRVSC